MYYILDDRAWDLNPARLMGEVDDQDYWWDDGESFDPPPKEPVRGTLRPFDPRHPSMSQELAAMYISSVVFMRDDLVDVLTKAGVDNLDIYQAEILDSDTGEAHTNYKAVNILGLVAAADMEKSKAIVHDGIPLVDVSFDEMVLDPSKTHGFLLFRSAENNGTILIHQAVKSILEKAGFTELEFYELDKAAI